MLGGTGSVAAGTCRARAALRQRVASLILPFVVPPLREWWRALKPVALDDRGQDLIEYALLASIIGVGGAAVMSTITDKMGINFSSWGAQVQAIWVPNDPR